MGLDQYWQVEGEDEEFHYHRKVPALEAFMSDKWKLENEGTFNCEKLYVTTELLDELQLKVAEKSLNNNASGFFWGSHYDDDYEDIQDAINKARERLLLGQKVYYSSWW